MRSAVEHNFVHVLLWFRLAVAIDVLDFHGRIVHEDADGEGKSTERHYVDRLSDRAKHHDGGQNRQRDRGRNNNRASPTAQKNKDHKSRQARGNQRFPDDTADRATNKDGLIRQRRYLELGWNRGLNLREKPLNAIDHVQC